MPLEWETVRARLVAAGHLLACEREIGQPAACRADCHEAFPDGALADRLAQASRDKFGYALAPSSYTSTGLWCLQPARVLSWQQFPRDATRFVFPSGPPPRDGAG